MGMGDRSSIYIFCLTGVLALGGLFAHPVSSFAKKEPDFLPPHYLEKPEKPVPGSRDLASVPAPVYETGFLEEPSDEEAVDPNGGRVEVPRSVLKREREWARSVFVARGGNGVGIATAFLVGPDLVLTSHHVLHLPADHHALPCGEFAVFVDGKIEVECRQVLWCSRADDVDLDACLVRMDGLPGGSQLGDSRPILPLSSQTPETGMQAALSLIGNTFGLGIQGAAGSGVTLRGKGAFDHFVSAGSGASGAPLLNSDGVVIGIHFGRIDDTYDPVSRGGMASRADRILEALDHAGQSAGVSRR